MSPSCKFKTPVWEHFDFLVANTNLHYEYIFLDYWSLRLLELNLHYWSLYYQAAVCTQATLTLTQTLTPILTITE